MQVGMGSQTVSQRGEVLAAPKVQVLGRKAEKQKTAAGNEGEVS